MIALANAVPTQLPIVNQSYEIDYETGVGTGRTLVRVKRITDTGDWDGEQVEALTHDERLVVFPLQVWNSLNPGVFQL